MGKWHPLASLTSSSCPEPGTLPAASDWRETFSRVIKIPQTSKKSHGSQSPGGYWIVRGEEVTAEGGGEEAAPSPWEGLGGRSQLPFWVKKMKFCSLKALDIPHQVTIPALPCWTESVRVDQDYPSELLEQGQGGLDPLDLDPSAAGPGDTRGHPWSQTLQLLLTFPTFLFFIK